MITRFTPTADDDAIEMVARPDGEYVRFADHARAMAEACARAEAALAQAKAQNTYLMSEVELLRADDDPAIENLLRWNAEKAEKLAILEQENEALKEKVARMSQPVSDEELTPHLLGEKWPITEAFDALIASRMSPAPEASHEPK